MRGRDYRYDSYSRRPQRDYSHGYHQPRRPEGNRNAGPSDSERRFMEGVVVDPSPRIRLEDGSAEMTMRALDLIAPIGMGTRGLIVSPPGSGKTTFLKHLCHAIAKSAPQAKLYVLLIDERPEEVTDFKRGVPGEVRASSSDHDYEHHIRTARDLMQQIYREVAEGANVVLLVDSLTRLSRVHNADLRTSGRTLSGGVDARALEFPRRLFGSARKIENGGSLTILATILVETGSRMDEVIFEEFKGTGNMEVVLSREIANSRIFPAIAIAKSGTRKEELLLAADELTPVQLLRRALSTYNPLEAVKTLLEQLQKHPTNRDLLATISAKTKSSRA